MSILLTHTLGVGHMVYHGTYTINFSAKQFTFTSYITYFAPLNLPAVPTTDNGENKNVSKLGPPSRA